MTTENLIINGVDLLWHAIGQIQMLNAKLAELRKDRDRLDWIFNNSKPIIAEKNDFDCNMCTAELWFSSDGCSGTTAKMAHKLKRNWILSEISSEYVQIAEKRIAPYSVQP